MLIHGAEQDIECVKRRQVEVGGTPPVNRRKALAYI
jgi:hypothetical protein